MEPSPLRSWLKTVSKGLQRSVVSRYGADQIRQVVAVAVGAPHLTYTGPELGPRQATS